MVWWLWILVGLMLCTLEILTPGGFYVLFFGLSAVTVGMLSVTGIAGPAWTQWLAFSVLSVLSLVLFRRPLMRTLGLDQVGGGHEPGTLIGESALLLGDVSAGGIGKAELRGTSWTVRNRESRALAGGTRCVVERVDGLTLWVRSENGGNANA